MLNKPTPRTSCDRCNGIFDKIDALAKTWKGSKRRLYDRTSQLLDEMYTEHQCSRYAT